MSQDPASPLLRATIHHQAGRASEAEALYREILISDPGNAEALHQFGVLACQNGRYDAAIGLIGRALRQDNGRAAFHNSLGSAYLSSGKTPEAVQAFKRALGLAPGSFEIRNNLANALEADGALAEAAFQYRTALDSAPDSQVVHNNLGRTLHLMKEFQTAADHFRLALKSKPNDPEILSNLGSSLCAKGDFSEAVDVCRRAISIDPGGVWAYYNLGAALEHLNRMSEAVDAFRRAAVIAPGVREFHKRLGVALSRLGNQAAAEESFTTALTLDPNDEAVEDIGHAYYALGQPEKAIALFRSVLERNRANRHCLSALGLALNDLGRHAEGLDAIARGPGLAHFSLASGMDEDAADPPERSPGAPASAPDFIGRWFMRERSLCEALIDFFEHRSTEHFPGRTNHGVNTAVKRSTDLVIFPNDLDTPDHAPVRDYLRHLRACGRDYVAQWPHFGEILKAADLVPFNIQRYDAGGHFQKPHCERYGVGSTHRVLAWMTYLNEVESGGETFFHHYGLSIQPERGKTLIWPAEWTHVHAGGLVKAGRKYIITGWMHFPHPAPSQSGI